MRRVPWVYEVCWVPGVLKVLWIQRVRWVYSVYQVDLVCFFGVADLVCFVCLVSLIYLGYPVYWVVALSWEAFFLERLWIRRDYSRFVEIDRR